MSDPRVSIVVLTHNRLHELDRTLRHLTRLPEQPHIIVVDNGSRDGSALHVKRYFPQVELVCCSSNQGAAARNAGVRRVRTPYVAFCDDDTWWEAGALTLAANLLDKHARLGVVAGRVLVGPGNHLDPTCERMAASPLSSQGLPGARLISFMAGAAVMRTQAFREAGGYEPHLFLGAEEALMGLDMTALGWQLLYASEVVVHHHPSRQGRDKRGRQTALARNRLWIAWMRLSIMGALQMTWRILIDASRDGVLSAAVKEAIADLQWVRSRRRVVPVHVQAMWLQVFGKPPAKVFDSQAMLDSMVHPQ